jgi:hypothetical protein
MASNPATFDDEAERPPRFSDARAEQERHRSLLLRLRQSLYLFSADSALAACIYIVLHCRNCGEVRQARADYPDSVAVACPACGLECGFLFLGVGLTRMPLPFHELHAGLTVDEEGNRRIPWDELPRRPMRLDEEE